MKLEDLKIYLPKFLSSESEKELFEGLKDFPENIDTRLYTDYLKKSKIIFQGDGLNDLLVVNLPNPQIKPVPSVVLSNTCDIDTENERPFPSQIVYTPLFNLKKYEDLLSKKSSKTEQQIEDHILAIKKQLITQIMFFPGIEGKMEDSIVFFDKVCNYPSNQYDRGGLENKRIFTLSNYGEYLFLLKLSIHFTRIKDKVDRNG